MSPISTAHRRQPPKGDSSSTRQFGGLGLGLSLAQGLVTTALGGSFTSRNRPEGGAEFFIAIPVETETESLGYTESPL